MFIKRHKTVRYLLLHYWRYGRMCNKLVSTSEVTRQCPGAWADPGGVHHVPGLPPLFGLVFYQVIISGRDTTRLHSRPFTCSSDEDISNIQTGDITNSFGIYIHILNCPPPLPPPPWLISVTSITKHKLILGVSEFI